LCVVAACESRRYLVLIIGCDAFIDMVHCGGRPRWYGWGSRRRLDRFVIVVDWPRDMSKCFVSVANCHGVSREGWVGDGG
jgi:hypothetical protein